jgi:GDP-4-dehydro-6-deoxy-D-mannose reductase
MSIGGRVLITGARGALGGHAARLLGESGIEVYGTHRSTSTVRASDSIGVRWVPCDLRNRDEVRSAVGLSRPSVVMHAAGLAGTSDLRALVEANVIALANLIEALAGTTVERLLVIGSAAEYAASDKREPIREDHPLAPSNPYGLSKQFQFELSRQAHRAGMPVVYARPFNVIGPGVSPVTAVGDITNRLAGLVQESGSDVLEVGDLNKWRDYTDVRDAAAACVTLLEHGRPGGVYNVCTGVPVLLADVVDRLMAMARKTIRLRRAKGAASASFQVGDSSRMRELGWAPIHDLDTSLRDGLESELRAINKSC